jgi:hypothetical protein
MKLILFFSLLLLSICHVKAGHFTWLRDVLQQENIGSELYEYEHVKEHWEHLASMEAVMELSLKGLKITKPLWVQCTESFSDICKFENVAGKWHTQRGKKEMVAHLSKKDLVLLLSTISSGYDKPKLAETSSASLVEFPSSNEFSVVNSTTIRFEAWVCGLASLVTFFILSNRFVCQLFNDEFRSTQGCDDVTCRFEALAYMSSLFLSLMVLIMLVCPPPVAYGDQCGIIIVTINILCKFFGAIYSLLGMSNFCHETQKSSCNISGWAILIIGNGSLLTLIACFLVSNYSFLGSDSWSYYTGWYYIKDGIDFEKKTNVITNLIVITVVFLTIYVVCFIYFIYIYSTTENIPGKVAIDKNIPGKVAIDKNILDKAAIDENISYSDDRAIIWNSMLFLYSNITMNIMSLVCLILLRFGNDTYLRALLQVCSEVCNMLVFGLLKMIFDGYEYFKVLYLNNSHDAAPPPRPNDTTLLSRSVSHRLSLPREDHNEAPVRPHSLSGSVSRSSLSRGDRNEAVRSHYFLKDRRANRYQVVKLRPSPWLRLHAD